MLALLDMPLCYSNSRLGLLGKGLFCIIAIYTSGRGK